MTDIKYINGDIFSNDERRVICHICNDIGKWGKGFVLAISNKWKEPEIQYRKWHKSNNNFILGEIQLVKVSSNTLIANMIAQHGIKSQYNPIPIQYDALRNCLNKLTEYCISNNFDVHMPMIGSGLAGGDWKIIESIIVDTLCKNNINVTVYKK